MRRLGRHRLPRPRLRRPCSQPRLPTAVEKMRDAKKAEYEQHGTKLTYMSFIAKAVLDAIRRHPVLNSSIDGDNIVYKRDVNLGIAVALDNGLIVPVIKNANEKNMLGI